MDRCPNCGSSTRTGARYCTSCGFKLPDAPQQAPAAPAPSPFATTSTVSSTGWAPPAAPAPEPGSAVIPAPVPPSAEAPAAPPPTGGGPFATTATVSSSSWAPAPPPAPAPDQPEVAPEPPAPSAAPTWGSAWTASDATTEAPEAPVLFPSSLSAPHQSAMAAASPQGQSVEAALRLVDELRAMLLDLEAAPTAVQGVVSDDELASVVTDVTGTLPDLGELRRIVAAAQTQSRDLDTMLGMVGQADTIASLLDAYDRLLAAARMASSGS